MKTIFAILLLLCVGGPSASNSAHASCFNAAQCNDGNQCTTDACVSTVCVNTNKADGTACSLGGYAHPSCLAGTCSTAEFCSDFFDNDEDGSTDERHYLLSNSCEGPRGVMEYSWNKLKPSGAPAVNAELR